MNNERLKSLYGLSLYFVIYTVGAFIIQFLIGFVVSNVYDISFATLLTASPFDHEINSKMYLASLNLLTYTNLFLFLAYFIGMIILFAKELSLAAKEFKSRWLKNLCFIGIGFVLLYGLNLLFSFIAERNGISDSSNQQLIEAMFKNNGIIPVFLSVVLLAPFVEEIIYRKCILGICQNKWLFYVITTLLFGFIHMIGTPITSPMQWLITFVPYAGSGLILAICYERTNNIYVSTAIHVLNNLLGYILLFM